MSSLNGIRIIIIYKFNFCKFLKINKLNIAKSLSWRFIGTIDTLIFAWLITGDFNEGLNISGITTLTKLVWYYIYDEVHLISKESSLELCMVAEGEADCYSRFVTTMKWDTAAGQAICKHAGFEVIDWSTKENMLYNREELLNNWFLVK